MPNEVGYPFDFVGVSAAISDASANVLVGRATNLAGATRTGGDVSIGGQSVTVEDITEATRFVRLAHTAAQINRTGVGSRATARRRGRVSTDLVLTCWYDYDANSTFDAFLKDQDGVRLVFIERKDGKQLAFVGEILTVEEPDQPDEGGDATMVITLGNSAHSGAPKWED